MAWAVRQALAPVRALAVELQARSADDLRLVPISHAPQELQPLLAAMNGLFGRIGATLARERRFTADAAHELRTPLAVLRAQWDVVRRSTNEPERRQAETRLAVGLDRMDRLVTQMLALSRLESTDRLPRQVPVGWAALVEQAMSDVLALAERRRIELGCEWPADGTPAFPLQGDADLLAVLLRNLLDNAIRHAPEGSTVTPALRRPLAWRSRTTGPRCRPRRWCTWASASTAAMARAAARPALAADWASRSRSASPNCTA